MNPLNSWITMILVLALVAAFVWWLKEVADLREARRMAENADAPAEEPLAPVIELRSALVQRQRHLSLVPNPHSEQSSDLYDWQVQGL